ncbi:hypothetical protein [Anaerobranca gottschalkii]|uniref:Uncharacterized protein n=1 Tax=Anaerobranca gottschalkii DSM 13577 TaxID=1120990 RepID=A0A1H9Z874_9FIRM|nr:hypothetical protein [Anaerobranca gottschalkii]SES77068.1 hypothetical protein SAMN03080614_10072 [Anaerobranca gottschalkii DSM 13577]
MTKKLLTRVKSFSIEKNNPYRTRKIKIEFKLKNPTTIEIKVHQWDWTLKRLVDDREDSYLIHAEYDYIDLANFLVEELNHIKYFKKMVEDWVEDRKYNFPFEYKGFVTKDS